MLFEKENRQDGQSNIINVRNETLCNQNFRKEIWTGAGLQITVMSIPVGGEIGLEMHDDLDQFIKVESGLADVYMGESKQCVQQIGKINPNSAVVVPSGTWHNIINACGCPLKVYSVYAPPKHKVGTVHKSKLDSDLSDG